MASDQDSFPCPGHTTPGSMPLPGRTAYIHHSQRCSIRRDRGGGSDRRVRRQRLSCRIGQLQTRQAVQNMIDKRKLALMDFHMWPDVLPFANHPSLTSVQARIDRERDLNRVTVRDTKIVQLPSRYSIDSRG